MIFSALAVLTFGAGFFFLESRLSQCIVGRLATSQAALGAISRLSPTV